MSEADKSQSEQEKKNQSDDTPGKEGGSAFSHKYLVLSGAMFWKDPEGNLTLTWTDQTVEHTLRAPSYGTDVEQPEIKVKDGSWWIATKDISVGSDDRLVKLIRRGVEAGILTLTNSYEKWLEDSQKEPEKSKKLRKGLVWKELELKAVRENKQLPRNPSIGRGTMAYSDSDSVAYKLLQESAQDLRRLLLETVGALGSKQQIENFLKEAFYIERKGYNRTAAPRSAVVDMIVDLMASHGIASGIGIVSQDREPITDNVTPLRIPSG